MKKKILAFFFALHIFCFSLVYCFCCPVYAVGEGAALFEGLQTLMLMLGVSVDLSSGISQSQWVTQVDDEFSNAIAQKNQEQQDILYDNYAEFKDNLQHGYMLISDTLFDFFKDTVYSDYLRPPQIASGAGSLSNYLGTISGYYIYINGYYQNNQYPYLEALRIYYIPSSNYDLTQNINIFERPVLVTSYSYSKKLQYGTINSPYNYNTRVYTSQPNEGNGGGLANYTNDLSFEVSNAAYSNSNYSYSVLGYIAEPVIVSSICDSLVGSMSKEDVDSVIDGVWEVGDDGYIYTDTGVLPQVLDDTTANDIVDDIKSGAKSWTSAISSITDSYPENPAMPEDTLTLPELDQLIADLHLERLQSKFPFCIPHDIQLIYSGATAVSANAPVLVIPIDITFKEHTYFHDDEFITIDFSMFDSIIPIFREGFFLLFLVGLLWVSIHILQAFFVVTE